MNLHLYLLAGLFLLLPYSLKAESIIPMDLVIIVHPDNPLTDISLKDLKRIWLGKILDVNGVRLLAVSAEDQLECKVVFYKSILKKSRKGLKRYYIHQELKGRFISPESIETKTRLLHEVTSDITAISFIDKADIPDSINVKILSIDGKHSNDKDYILK